MPDHDIPSSPDADDAGTYRIEIRFDVTGTRAEAQEAARRAAEAVDGEVTAIFDDNWNEI